MRRAALPMILGGLLLLGLVVLLQTQQRERAGFPAPGFRLPTLDGQTIVLSDYRGKVVFLNFWATWCPPCREEMPSMQRLHQRFAQRPFVMIAVNEDTSAEPVRRFLSELGLTFAVALDPQGTLPARYGVTGYPETFLIDHAGLVVRHVIGPLEWDDPSVVAYIEELVRTAEVAVVQGDTR